jgi:hypothetical protein
MPVFESALALAAADIRDAYRECRYDHRPFLPPSAEAAHAAVFTDVYRASYAAFKYAVAQVLQPRCIAEIGVGFGVAARAMMAASPAHVNYIGYDNGSMHPESIPFARSMLVAIEESIGCYAQLEQIDDSLSLVELPPSNLIHVDGCHLYSWAYHDVSMALRAAEWVLVDDARDSQVAAATLAAIWEWRAGDVDWCYFEDTWTGNILIHTAEAKGRGVQQ